MAIGLDGISLNSSYLLSCPASLPKNLENFISLAHFKSEKHLFTLELLMKDQIMPFVIRKSYLNRFQSGFRSAHSTTTALLNVTDDFRQACERRLIIVLLLLDFSKAFDSVIHDLLCNKLLSSFNFDPTAGDELSSPIQKGVLQGSILGSILFSLLSMTL
jgi:Reverse transcriptase (RNA-dependent DNA polymerase)